MLAWTAPSFAAVKGIVHAPCAKPRHLSARCVSHPNRHTWINHAKPVFDDRAALVYFREARLLSD
jgi:hypothetical protein